MAFADLSPQAKEGLNWKANRLNAEDKARKGDFLPDGITPRPDLFATGKEYMDFIAERDGCAEYEMKYKLREAQRLAKLVANSTIASQVDAIPDIPGVN